MPAMKTLGRRKRPKQRKLIVRHTPERKAQFIDLITRDSVAGLTVKEIAAKHGISTASIYRWWRQRDEFQHELNARAMNGQLEIEGALELLSSSSQTHSALKREAIFQLLAWIRWPADQGFRVSALINCIASYIHQRYGVIAIDKIPQCDSEVLFKYLTIDIVARFSSPNAAFNPDFEIVTNQTSRYDDRQFFADVVGYLLTDDVNRRGRRPTLDQLQFLVGAGAFGPGWSMSPRTFEKFWRSRVASFPFLYVEQYHSPFDWSLNPSDEDFAQSVDEIVEELDGMKTYLGRVKWVISELELRLDPRAVRRIDFPRLPSQLEAIPTKTPALNSRLLAKIAELV